MSRRGTKAKAPGAGRPGAFGPPPDMDRRTRRQFLKLVNAQLAELESKQPPRVPHLYRWRFQLAPLAWLAGAGLAGLMFCGLHARLAAALAAALTVAITVAATRSRSRFPRAHTQGMAAWVSSWVLALSLLGPGRLLAGAGLAGWAVPSAFWLEHYRWRELPAAAGPPGEDSITARWRDLCETQKWSATLGPARPIPGGARYPIICAGSKTPIGKITGKPEEIAAAFDSAITTAFAEPAEDGIRSKGTLTLLRESTLETIRPWDGGTIDPATGLAVVGRFPEGGAVHECFFTPGVGGGAAHSIVGGADGSGKTGLLDLSLCISVQSGVIAPVILDPQMGQALPAWQEVIPYACGVEDCMTWLRGLYAAMMARSEYLAGLTWKHPRTGRTRKGMGWFDPYITGLPIIEITIDEAPILLAVKGAAELLRDIAKLGRKVGFRLRLACQVPSVAELKISELRSILVGGSVFGLRAGDKVTGGMLNITGKPSELPRFFRDGKRTRGLGYAATIENRPGVTMRTDHIEEERLYDFADSWKSRVRQPDRLVAERVDAALTMNATLLAGLQSAAADEAGMQLRVLSALTGPMRMGELIVAADGLGPSQVVDAVAGLELQGRARRGRDGIIEPVST